jgi:enoyl-CoA hydratase/carnithine racemase
VNYETLLVEHSDKIATVTLNRPNTLNAFNRRMVEEFAYFWTWAANQSDVHCIVLRAAGRAFSAGADIKSVLEPGGALISDDVWNIGDPGTKLGPKSCKCWKPLITAVNGMCSAGAFYWINESDILICSEEATFFDSHTTYGLVASLEPIGARYRMPLGEVLRMILLGNDERIGAQTALRIGLVSEVVAAERLWDRARELATLIAAKPPTATSGAVKAVWDSLDLPRSVALHVGIQYAQLGNPKGTPDVGVDRAAVMGNKSKKFEIR